MEHSKESSIAEIETLHPDDSDMAWQLFSGDISLYHGRQICSFNYSHKPLSVSRQEGTEEIHIVHSRAELPSGELVHKVPLSFRGGARSSSSNTQPHKTQHFVN